jgi:hypothetical protein
VAALASLNFSRGERIFGHVGSASQTTQRAVKIGAKTFQCPCENIEGVVEPRRIVRGNLAQSIFTRCHLPAALLLLTNLYRFCSTWHAAKKEVNGSSTSLAMSIGYGK